MKTIKEWIQIVLGLLVFSAGVHFTIQANIGLAPWDSLGMGISYHTPLNYGIAMTAISVLILILDIIMKEQIGFGTIIDAICTGNFINMFITISPFKPSNLFVSLIFICIGLFLMALGQVIYMKAQQGCGPRDAFLLGLGKRLPKISIGVVEIIIYVVVVAVAFVLGGPIGVGTLITTIFGGIAMDIVCRMVKFEPRSIHHRNVFQTMKEFK